LLSRCYCFTVSLTLPYRHLMPHGWFAAAALLVRCCCLAVSLLLLCCLAADALLSPCYCCAILGFLPASPWRCGGNTLRLLSHSYPLLFPTLPFAHILSLLRDLSYTFTLHCSLFFSLPASFCCSSYAIRFSTTHFTYTRFSAHFSFASPLLLLCFSSITALLSALLSALLCATLRAPRTSYYALSYHSTPQPHHHTHRSRCGFSFTTHSPLLCALYILLCSLPSLTVPCLLSHAALHRASPRFTALYCALRLPLIGSPLHSALRRFTCSSCCYCAIAG
jgi:hypothetical protein